MVCGSREEDLDIFRKSVLNICVYMNFHRNKEDGSENTRFFENSVEVGHECSGDNETCDGQCSKDYYPK